MFSLVLILVLPPLKQSSTARALTVSGDKVARMAAAAQQNAIENRTMTALIVLVDHDSDANFRAVTIAQREYDGCWHQITSWELLADGVTLDLDRSHCTFLYNSPTLPGFSANQIAYQDLPLAPADFACRIFLPHGGLSTPKESARIRLVEGVVRGAGPDVIVNYENEEIDGPARCYDISIAGNTGEIKVQCK